jgi:hypothetical protein
MRGSEEKWTQSFGKENQEEREHQEIVNVLIWILREIRWRVDRIHLAQDRVQWRIL